MEVHCDEGVAIHIGPEPCVHARENMVEASVGERIGQPLSRERHIPDADAVDSAEGNTDGARHCECPDGPAWSETLACAEAPCTGTGISHVWPMDTLSPKARIGKVRSRSR